MKSITDILYLYVSDRRDLLLREIAEAGGQPTQGQGNEHCLVLQTGGKTLRIFPTDSLEKSLKMLTNHYFSFVVVDARRCPKCPCKDDCTPLSIQFMKRIHYAADADKRYPLSRIIAVVPHDKHLAEHSFELGKLRIGGFVCDPFSGTLVEKMSSLYDPDPGKTAICLAGGGIEGFLFELGVMMGLNAHLQARSTTDFEIFCGISAGAILAALMANLSEPEDIADTLFNPKTGTKKDMLSPAHIYDFNVSEYLSRLWAIRRSVPLLSGTELVSTLLRSVPIGFFRGDALHDFLERHLTSGGRTNDFRMLKRELYIGATDQDRASPVVFGDGQWRDVPISQAVRASAALTPFFGPTRIGNRYFVDGQYTRTSNLHVAVERGAKLVIVVNPLVPVRVENTGYVSKKGGVFGALQGLKAVIHTRFLQAFQASVDAYPDVDFVLFEPEGELVRLMGGSPMKYNLRTEILNVAYRSTVKRVQRDFEVLRGTFERHDFRLQRHPRLRAKHTPVW
ncbi:MAG: patatin-like phospholipase family protein [Deltaproteobacteria bacterium]|nr:patatin-like phospholipase family protein [Deltaproteobacteria bacterium]